MSEFRTDSILPPPPEGALPILHNREYRVQSWRLDRERILVQGGVRDQKPAGLYVPGDPEPLTLHHMQLALEIAVRGLEILSVQTQFATYPQTGCTSIIDRYDQLVGLSLTRGFTHKVRELFGGPRGCSHTTALLQAMAPVAMQSLKSMEVHAAAEDGEPHPFTTGSVGRWDRLVNTCHVWAEDGEIVAALKAGTPRKQIIPIAVRTEALNEASS